MDYNKIMGATHKLAHQHPVPYLTSMNLGGVLI
jgi:hypothetical protein